MVAGKKNWQHVLICSLFDLQDRIIARLQQPYSLDCIPVEAEYQVSCHNYRYPISYNFLSSRHHAYESTEPCVFFPCSACLC